MPEKGSALVPVRSQSPPLRRPPGPVPRLVPFGGPPASSADALFAPGPRTGTNGAVALR